MPQAKLVIPGQHLETFDDKLRIIQVTGKFYTWLALGKVNLD